MNILRKELRNVDFQIEGSDLKGEPISQTTYDFDLKIDELLNKPAFMVNTTSQVLFPSNDRILFGSFVAFFFDEKNTVPSAEQLWDLVLEAFDMINNELQMKANINYISLQSPKKQKTLERLKILVLSGFRLN